MKTKNLKQIVTFQATPREIYDLLMTSKHHAAFTGAKARISQKVRGAFSAYEGWVQGKNLKLVKGKKIVQLWRGKDWPKGHYSLATYTLAKNKNGTKLTFTHEKIPTHCFNDIKKGWTTHYWGPMKKYLKKI